MTEHTNALSRRSFLASAALATSALAGAGIVAHPLEAYAVTSAEKRAEAAAALEKLTSLEEQLDIASADYGTALAEQQAAQDRMDDAQSRIDQANADIESLQDQLATRARSMYRTGSSSFIDMLLGATSFQAFSTNWDILNEMNESDSRLVEETKSLRNEVEQQKEVYAQQEAVAAEQAKTCEELVVQAQALVDEMEQTYDSLTEEAEELLAQEEEARRQEEQRRAEEELARQRAAAEAAAAAAAANAGNASNSGGNTSSNSNASSSSSSASNGGGNVNNSKVPSVSPSTVLARAREMMGKPYVWGAVGPNSFDCSGFVGYCLRGDFQRHWTTYQIYYWDRVTDPQPGDICIRWSHTGVYVGNGRMIHASTSGGVIEAPVQSGMFYVRY